MVIRGPLNYFDSPLEFTVATLVYAGIAGQSGANAPSVIELYNTLGHPLVPSRQGPGEYRLTGVVGDFPADRTLVLTGSPNSPGDSVLIHPTNTFSSRIEITTSSFAGSYVPSDDVMGFVAFHIYVYPEVV